MQGFKDKNVPAIPDQKQLDMAASVSANFKKKVNEQLAKIDLSGIHLPQSMPQHHEVADNKFQNLIRAQQDSKGKPSPGKGG